MQIPSTPLIPVGQTFITDALASRAVSAPDYFREKIALQDLAEHMSGHPSEMLPRLVQLSLEICEASSAGISILEPETNQFRWFGLKGILSVFEGEKTPRNNSPCGLCLDLNGPVLLDRPERAFDWIRDAAISVPEVLLVPLATKGLDAMGTLWVVAEQSDHFHAGHARVLSELSRFAALALRQMQTEEKLQLALQDQEILTREMSHRVKNLFALTTSLVRMSRRGASTAGDFADKLIGRLEALAEANALVRRQFGDTEAAGVPLDTIVSRILRPYGYAKATISGPIVQVGQRSTNSIALIFHELATNSAKYGSLSAEQGSVAVDFSADEQDIRVSWKEVGGPKTKPPSITGFGSRLIETTIRGAGGDIEYRWPEHGMQVHLRLPLSALKA